MNVRRRARGIGRALHRHARVGAPAPGFVTVYPGWNVWALWQSEDPIRGVFGTIWNLGVSPEREFRIWVEDQIKTNAPGTAVADPANPAALRGEQIQIIPNAGGLATDATRADIPELAGGVQLGAKDSKTKLTFVRFYNRGQEAAMPWPHDENVLLDASYVPSSTNSVTNAAPPSSLGGTASQLASDAGSVVKVIAIGGGLVLATVLAIAIANSRKATA